MNTLSVDQVSMAHLISFSRYQLKCVLSFYLYRWWHHKLLRFFLDQLVKQWLTGRKRGEDENTQIWISREWKELFKWNKNHENGSNTKQPLKFWKILENHVKTLKRIQSYLLLSHTIQIHDLSPNQIYFSRNFQIG